MKKLEKIFQHQYLENSVELAKCMDSLSFDDKVKDTSIKATNTKEIKPFSFEAVKVHGNFPVNHSELLLLPSNNPYILDMIPISLEMRSNPDQFYLHTIGSNESYVMKP